MPFTASLISHLHKPGFLSKIFSVQICVFLTINGYTINGYTSLIIMGKIDEFEIETIHRFINTDQCLCSLVIQLNIFFQTSDFDIKSNSILISQTTSNSNSMLSIYSCFSADSKKKTANFNQTPLNKYVTSCLAESNNFFPSIFLQCTNKG